MKERREKEKERRRDAAPLGGAEGEEKFPHLKKPPHWWGDQLGWKGSFGGYQRRAQMICGRHYFTNKGPSGQGYGFSSGHVWM